MSSAAENRFLGSADDPRFRTMPRKDRRVKIDERFASMFTDKRFSVEATMDKFGNPILERESRAMKDLKRLYELDGESNIKVSNFLEDEDPESESEPESEKEKLVEEKEVEARVSEEKKNEDFIKVSEPAKVPDKSKYSFAREEPPDGLGMFYYEPDSDTSTSEKEEEDRLEKLAREISPEPDEIQTTMEPSRKLGLVNMTWSNLRAVDILAVMRGFCPPSGEVKRVAIHHTKEGVEEQLREIREGPRVDVYSSAGIDPYDVMEQARVDALNKREIRKHEKAVLGWNYGYVECDSKETAHTLYKQMDGINFQATGDLFDLRFMDDDFEPPADEPVRDEATEVPADYEPPLRGEFVAGTHTVPVLTFDHEDLKRKAVLTHRPQGDEPYEYSKFTPYLAEDNVDAGYNTEEVVEASDSEGEKTYLKRRARKRYLSLLEELPKRMEEDDYEAAVTFHSALSTTGQKLLKKHNSIMDETTEERKRRVKREKRSLRRQKKRDWIRLKNLNIQAVQQDKQHHLEKIPASPTLPEAEIQEEDSDSEPVKKKKKKKKKRLLPDPELPIIGETEFVDSDQKTKKKKKKKKRLKKRDREEHERELAELSLLTMGKDENEGFNLNQLVKANTKKKKKRKKYEEVIPEDTFQIDPKDDRFKALYSNPDFYLDPNSSKFHKTAQMEKVLKRTREKRQEMLESMTKVPGRPKVTSSASTLAKRLKEKNRRFKRKKERGV